MTQGRHGLPWTADDDARLRKMRNAKRTYGDIAEALGRSEETCRARMKALRYNDASVSKQEHRPWFEADVAQLIRMREVERLVWTDIDRAMGRSRGSACGKYTSLRRGSIQVSKFGGGGRIDATDVERDRAERAGLVHPTLAGRVFGDPLPGQSALDKRQQRAGGAA